MLNAVGETVAVQTAKIEYNNQQSGKEALVQETAQIREKRPVEASNEGTKADLKDRRQEGGSTKTTIEEGKVVVEKYDASGKLIEKSPPGYLPFGEVV